MTRGGSRPNAGRKPALIPKKHYSLRLTDSEYLKVKELITQLRKEVLKK